MSLFLQLALIETQTFESCGSISMKYGPPYTYMIEGQDHEIVRALETHQRPYQGKLEMVYLQQQAFKCSLKTCDWTYNQMLFHRHPI